MNVNLITLDMRKNEHTYSLRFVMTNSAGRLVTLPTFYLLHSELHHVCAALEDATISPMYSRDGSNFLSIARTGAIYHENTRDYYIYFPFHRYTNRFENIMQYDTDGLWYPIVTMQDSDHERANYAPRFKEYSQLSPQHANLPALSEFLGTIRRMAENTSLGIYNRVELFVCYESSQDEHKIYPNIYWYILVDGVRDINGGIINHRYDQNNAIPDYAIHT